MKKVTASEARRNWFRLLDEVVAGETVAIDRHGTRVLMVREVAAPVELPEYGELLRAPGGQTADQWGWHWEGEEGDLIPTDHGEGEG